ncbi:MAG: DUF2142 domain-containing protein [Candidatus Saccharibacteria bacterium]|nr:DUF2142 domain-containing protein [Candidatus Saccharibacteria bacterium]
MKSKKSSQSKTTLLAKVFGSNWFFGLIVIFFLLQTIWIAFSGIYPMLFDEEYHLGIIDIYSRQISPFIQVQPPEAAFHGDITRYGSYLFHYIMSVPYSLITHFTHDLQTTVIAMRLICIGFVIAGLFVFRAFLLRAGLTKSLTHLAIGFFTLIPLVPFAYSQINYDSLAFLMIALIFYLALRAVEKTDKQALWIILLLSTSSLASLVKFTILPIAFANVLFVFIVLWRKSGSKMFKKLFVQFKKLPKLPLILSLLLLFIGIGLFTERYGVNIVQYHAIEPKCDRIHSDEECVQYTVWRRDNKWKQNNDMIGLKRDNPLVYTATYWAPHIYGDYTVTAAFVYPPGQSPQIRYLPTKMQASAGAPILRAGSWAILVVSVIVLALTWRKLPNRKLRYMVALTVLIYATSLWVRNYTDYLHIGAGTAAQGRYFIPLMIPMLAIVGLAFRHILKRMRYQAAFLVVCLLLLSQGGGIATYILYSNSNWYWENGRQTINSVNQSARNTLKLFIVR